METPAMPPAAPPVLRNLHGLTMGTTWSVRLVAPPALSMEAAQRGVQVELDLVDGQMSTYKPASALSQYNTAPAGTWQSLPAELFAVFERALALARDTGGAYDPTVGPLVELWGFGPGGARREPPPPAAIAAARSRAGWWRIGLDAATRLAYQPGGIYVDLSSIAKGYAVDRVGRWLDAAGATAWLVEVGGELKARGAKPDGTPWRVGIERPDAAAGEVERADQLTRVVTLRDRAIATSGDYRRRFTDGGQAYAHHIDPRSGHPVPHAVASVSVLAGEAIQADPLGTTLTVLGPERGLAYAEEHGLAVLFLLRGDRGFEERMSSAFAAALEP
ncbi:FAD:protein FMN transferase [Frateuria defendens]|uniref:FAD:protein FMN transferase n=1 Tax=Frateuria defendens TaxID=2219559 RepID=UPI00066FE452|nr:FAD:protein FMN transferase [Frateuria defendens]